MPERTFTAYEQRQSNADAEGKTVVGMISDAQAAAEAKVTELANGQVATNANDIAALFEMLTWGEFPSEPLPE